ncbi:threonine aldolase family protein [Volucribacter amazonae]|uniref:Threonine aldolase n=1 Tax=Volucribacter amazonae TaxID=256731 RepID=A0A9X4PFD3_9PAST|nr:beta-eliminating lyase-related protein [Volucribacter amazonae]MDG6896239.1 threonine aldolase [Volucribacter amazonae]
MLHFENDYNRGVHPVLLNALQQTNDECLAGYGADIYSARAKEKMKTACACPQAEVDFLVGGTQTNQVVIAAMLRPYQGVVAVETGHISVHEAGAIEYSGHKVLTLPAHQGKMCAQELRQYLSDFYADGNYEHMVFPGMVYISHPTEYGTLYSESELTELAQICQQYQLPLFLDGARLGYGLAVKGAVDLPTIAKLVDVFYIGGTKMGALVGEAVVFTKGNRPAHFMTMIKQHGALLAKGRLLGVQFDCLFSNNLYQQLGRHAIEMAQRLKSLLQQKGYRFYLDSPTNQQFVIVENQKLAQLAEKVCYGFWEKYDDHHTVIRFATSWSTRPEEIEALAAIL